LLWIVRVDAPYLPGSNLRSDMPTKVAFLHVRICTRSLVHRQHELFQKSLQLAARSLSALRPREQHKKTAISSQRPPSAPTKKSSYSSRPWPCRSRKVDRSRESECPMHSQNLSWVGQWNRTICERWADPFEEFVVPGGWVGRSEFVEYMVYGPMEW